ncbi:MAG: hypothetical protein QM681_05540 [Novosphingobium sp.]
MLFEGGRLPIELVRLFIRSLTDRLCLRFESVGLRVCLRLEQSALILEGIGLRSAHLLLSAVNAIGCSPCLFGRATTLVLTPCSFGSGFVFLSPSRFLGSVTSGC